MNLKEDPEIVAKNLSKLSYGFSSADIANICNEACILAVRNNLTVFFPLNPLLPFLPIKIANIIYSSLDN